MSDLLLPVLCYVIGFLTAVVLPSIVTNRIHIVVMKGVRKVYGKLKEENGSK